MFDACKFEWKKAKKLTKWTFYPFHLLWFVRLSVFVCRTSQQRNKLFFAFCSLHVGMIIKICKNVQIEMFRWSRFHLSFVEIKANRAKNERFSFAFLLNFSAVSMTDDKINCVAITANLTGDLFQFWLQTRRNEKKNFILAIETWTAHESENDECFLTPSLNFN